MEFNEFREKVKEALPDFLTDDLRNAEIKDTAVNKLQGESYSGISVTPEESRVGVSINLEDAFLDYQTGSQFTAVMNRLADTIVGTLGERNQFDLGFLADYSAVKNMLTVEVVGKDQNAEMLQSVPHQEMEDLAAVYRIDLGETENGNASVLITNEMLRNYGLTPDHLHQDALDAAQHTMKYSMNNCYASIELLHRPELRGKPLAVGGDPEARHGIVLAKDQLAKKAGVKTGMALWQAKQVCPDIVFVPPRMDLYLRFSRLAHEIYSDYTDRQEAFGIDESWLDVTESCSLKGSGEKIAEEISRRIKKELGITVSIGVSWNKIFAKLGSDYKKPDAITVINQENYRNIVWPLPVEDLLFVGRATKNKLNKLGIYTIGALAETNPDILKIHLGKVGMILSYFANGNDNTPVCYQDENAPIKSIGNSTTTPRDLTTETDVSIIVWLLAESVSARLREHHFIGNVVEISVRDKDLFSFTRQKKVPLSTNITSEIATYAMELFRANYNWQKPIRSVGVRVSDLQIDTAPVQLSLFSDQERRERYHRMDQTVDIIRKRFGFYSIQRGIMYQDRKLSALNAKEDNIVHPCGYMQRGNLTGVR